MIHFNRLKNRQRKSSGLFITAMIALLFSAQQLNAQAPGYLGQRFLIGGYVSVFPALWNYNANMNQGFTSFNFRKTLEVEYVASRRVAIGFHYDFMNTGVPYDEYNIENYTGVVLPDAIESKQFQIMLTRAPGIQIKLFKVQSKGALAPLGNYFAWNFSLIRYQVWNLKNDDYNTLTAKAYESDGSKLLAGIEWGSQRIFFNRIVFRTGLQFNLLTGFGAANPDKIYLKQDRIAYSAAICMGLSLIVPYHQKVD